MPVDKKTVELFTLDVSDSNARDLAALLQHMLPVCEEHNLVLQIETRKRPCKLRQVEEKKQEPVEEEEEYLEEGAVRVPKPLRK